MMDMSVWLEKWFHRGVDLFYEIMPQSFADKGKLRQCKIISHRGEHDNKMVYENTIPAFDQVNEAGVWGIEFDIRWTKDLQPVVFHDQNLQRLFKSDTKINEVTLAELKTHCNLIPTLSEVIKKYGKKMHFMVEIKKEAYPDPDYQNNLLRDLFQPMTPEVDFHFIALDPEMFMFINFVPSSTFIPSARLNVKQLSDLALKESYGGIAGHYVMISDRLLKKHHTQNQCVGTGYIRSKNCLFRELNRGVEWIFSNHSIKLQSICNSLLKSKP
ncbi:MAG: glycerophosphodiester phosphodiesterase [Deltaproteobacteria bacterium]|jgi:glycerophosphoryl diester phosphodiesterase|nr:glycerophosphodiester phosphodiesterase [Deltaproteobacteria bacterium]